MIKYHGTPITPNSVFGDNLKGRNVLIPFPRPDQLKLALSICDKIIIDNGAFSVFRRGISIDWNSFYSFLTPLLDKIEFFFIPDVIDGTEEENKILIEEYEKHSIYIHNKGVPIWHLNESEEQLLYMMGKYDYIAIGSSGEFFKIGTDKWHTRMGWAMNILCDSDGFPKVKIHMLRCLNPDIFRIYPFHSGDSTTLAQNHARDGAKSIIERLERYDSPTQYKQPSQRRFAIYHMENSFKNGTIPRANNKISKITYSDFIKVSYAMHTKKFIFKRY